MMARLLDMGAGPNPINKDLILHVWKDSSKSIKLLQLRAVNRKVVILEGFGPLFIHIGNLGVCAWLEMSKPSP